MPFNGTGTFNRSYNWVNDKNNGINITASRMDGDSDGFATGLSTCITKDGQQTATARVPFALGISYPAGTVSGVSMNLSGDITTGIYSSAAGATDIASSGVRVGGFNANGLDNTVIGAGTPLAGHFTTLGATGASTLAAVTATTLNKLTLTAPASAATLTLVDGSSLITSGANSLTLTTTGSTNVTLPTTGTLTTTAALSAYAPLASPALTGTPTAPTASASTSTTQLATTAFVNGTALTLASGTTAATQTAADNSTKVATTAYVDTRGGTALGVGSMILGQIAVGNTIAANATTAAANITVVACNASGTFTGTSDSITGTWKSLQSLSGPSGRLVGLFLRTA